MQLIDNGNFLLWAAANYDPLQRHSTAEFVEDLGRIKYIKKLVTKYIETGELKERLILNHLIVLNNVFGPENLCKIVFFKMEKQLCYIKPFLVYLNVLPERVYGIKSTPIDTTEIMMDQRIVEALRKQ